MRQQQEKNNELQRRNSWNAQCNPVREDSAVHLPLYSWHSKKVLEVMFMDYKKELIQLIQQINDETLAERIYVFVKRFVRNWEAWTKGAVRGKPCTAFSCFFIDYVVRLTQVLICELTIVLITVLIIILIYVLIREIGGFYADNCSCEPKGRSWKNYNVNSSCIRALFKRA